MNQLYKCIYPLFLKLFSQITDLTFSIHVFIFYPNSVLYLIIHKTKILVSVAYEMENSLEYLCQNTVFEKDDSGYKSIEK